MKRMAANNMLNWQGWSMMRNITVPTLVVTGERDNYFPRDVFEDVGKMIPNAEIYDVGTAKHKVQLERHSAVTRAIERFIDNDKQGSWRQQDAAQGHALKIASGCAATAMTRRRRCPFRNGRYSHSWKAPPDGCPNAQRPSFTTRS